MRRKLGRWWIAVLGMVCTPAFVCAQEVLEKCPREHLREVYLQAVERHEMVDLAAVEVEVLKLCRERQDLISEIVRGERELTKLLAEHASGAKATASARRADSSGLPALLPAGGQLTPAGTSGEGHASPNRVSSRPGPGGRGTPSYRWFTVYGSGNSLVAGVTDGRERWWVQAGDRLPGGVEVISVGVRPVSVRAATDGQQWQLSGPARVSPAVASVENKSQ